MYLLCRKINLGIFFKENLQISGIRNVGNKNKIFDGKILKLPPEPTNCCMSGCANCVWVEYAQELTKLFHDQDDKIKKLILDKITDPNMRAFLEMELRIMKSLQGKKDDKKDEETKE